MSVVPGTDGGHAPGLVNIRVERVPTDSLRKLCERENGRPVFGAQKAFQRPTYQWECQAVSPMAPDYEMSPGYQLVLGLTSAVLPADPGGRVQRHGQDPRPLRGPARRIVTLRKSRGSTPLQAGWRGR